jgi:hypothetical protein
MSMHAKVAVVFALSIGVGVHAANARLAAAAGRIAFESDRGGNRDIYIMDADGENVTQLTNNLAADFQPDWSPDGTQFLWQHWDLARLDTDIYVADADGRRQRNLTEIFGADSHPDWHDPSFVRAVSPAGRLAVTWGSLQGPSQ